MNIQFLSETLRLLEKLVQDKNSEIASSYPDIPIRVWTRDGYPRTARQACAVLLIVPLAVPSTQNKDLYLDLINHIARRCEHYKAEGKWAIVGRILHNYHTKPVDLIMSQISATMTTQDWFGNFVPELERACRALKVQRQDYSVVHDSRPVRRPKRKRGYDDKGHLSPDPWPVIPVPEDPDKLVIIVEDPPAWQMWKRYKRDRP
jgi:hypothetical protein